MSPLLIEQTFSTAGGGSVASEQRFHLDDLKLALNGISCDHEDDELEGAIVPSAGSAFDPFELVPKGEEDCDGIEKKCAWLRRQVVGCDAEFESPFGRRRITYADFTASGRFLQCVEEYISKHVLPFYGNTHTVDSHVGLKTTKAVNEACSYIKRCVGAGNHDALLFCGTGATAAIKRLQEVMGVAVPSVLRPCVVGCVPSSQRWVIFTGPYEHHSNLLSWRQSLAEVVEIGLDESGLVDLAALDAVLRSPMYEGRPKLGSFSACSNVTGICSDTRAIASVLHQHGAYACFDFASSGPYVDMEMKCGESDGYDAVFISPHKFVGGPGSPGILVINEALYRLKGSPPSTSGGGTVLFVNSYSEEDTLYSEEVEEREDAGTPGIVQKIRAALAFFIKEYMGHNLICAREEAIVHVAISRLGKNHLVRVMGNTTTKDRLPTISFLLHPGNHDKHLHCRFVAALLNDLFGIQAGGGCACAGPYGHSLLGIDRARSKAIRDAVKKGYTGVKPGWTRVSFCYYVASDELEFVIDAIELVAAYGHRFLSLYRFDWKSGVWSFKKMGSGWHQMIKFHAETVQREGDVSTKYAVYLAIARRIAVALPDYVSNQTVVVPAAIDSELVDFVV